EVTAGELRLEELQRQLTGEGCPFGDGAVRVAGAELARGARNEPRSLRAVLGGFAGLDRGERADRGAEALVQLLGGRHPTHYATRAHLRRITPGRTRSAPVGPGCHHSGRPGRGTARCRARSGRRGRAGWRTGR